jgi:deoxyribose-phosphate aldolase
MNNKIDHTLLKSTTTSKDIVRLCDECSKYRFRGICIPPCYTKVAANNLHTNFKLSTVVGYPFGYSTCKIKAEEANRALNDGAEEIDLVWNLGRFLNKEYLSVVEELSYIVEECSPNHVKVIVEESLIPVPELKTAWKIVRDSGAWAIKTGTGYASSARLYTVELWKALGNDLKIKASGGIGTGLVALLFINAGADIIGTSSGVFIAEDGHLDIKEYYI